MKTIFQILLAVGAVLIFIWMLLGQRKSSDENQEIDPTDPRTIGTLTGLMGGTIADAVVIQFALDRFEKEHGHKPTVREMGIVAGMIKGMRKDE